MSRPGSSDSPRPTQPSNAADEDDHTMAEPLDESHEATQVDPTSIDSVNSKVSDPEPTLVSEQADYTIVEADDSPSATLVDAPASHSQSAWGSAETVAANAVVAPTNDDIEHTLADSPPSTASQPLASAVHSPPVFDPQMTLIDSTPATMDAEQNRTEAPFDPDETKFDDSPKKGFVPREPAATIIEPANAGTRGSSAKTGFATSAGATGSRSQQERPLSAPRAEDRYTLVDNFAHGGLGNIWRAEDKSIHREVAFKELLPRALKNKLVVERFIEEAQITGQLEHPGIVPIYDLGYQENGTPFYAMKLVKGTDMDKAITAMHQLPRDSTERQLAFTRLLRQFVAVCQAVAYAHEKGVLHRDLKPLNVMIGEFGETLVLDWGLAKVLDVIGEQMIATDSGGRLDNVDVSASSDDATMAEHEVTGTNPTRGPEKSQAASQTGSSQTGAASIGSSVAGKTEEGTWFRRQVMTDARTADSQTMMGQVLGTVAYMPPEQAEGLVKLFDARTDIYSLGGILYKLLTNQQSAPRGKVHDVLKLVIAGQIKPPCEVDASVPKPLDAICRKAMSRLQDDRYSKALALAADVEAWLADEPVSVFPDPWTTKARRWAKRHRTLVVSSTLTAAVLISGLLLWTFIEANRIDGLRRTALTKSGEARRSLDANDFSKADSLLAEAIGIVQSEPGLSSVTGSLRDQLADVVRLRDAAERERVAAVRAKVVQRLSDADSAINEQNDLPQAKVVLTEVVTLLASEKSLVELREKAGQKLNDVNISLAQLGEVSAAKAQFAKFESSVEQVRVLGSGISGEEAMDDVRRGKELAIETLAIFEIDFENPQQRDARFKLLGESNYERWRMSVLELLIVIGQAEATLAIKDNPEDLQAASQRGLERVIQAEQLNLNSAPLRFLKSGLLSGLGRTSEAEKAATEANQLPPQTWLDHFLLGERARTQRQISQAVSHYQDALRIDPDDFWSLYLIGQTYQLGNALDASVASYTACIARRPNFVWPYIKRGVAFTQLRQFDNAQRDFERALELDPQSYHVLLNRGFLFLVQKQYDKSRLDFEAAAAQEPKLASPHVNQAELSRQQGIELASSDRPDGRIKAAAEFQKAIVSLTKAAEIVPQEAGVYLDRGRIHQVLNASTAAQADFQRAIQLTANPFARALCFREIGVIHQRANRHAEALAAFDQSLANNPANNSVILQRAEALNALGRLPEAVAAFTVFLEKNGPHADAYRARGLAFAALNKYAEAINDYTMSLQYESAPNMLTRRGWAYLNQAANLAKQDFVEARKLNPQNPENHTGLAYALVQLGDYESATKIVDNVAAATRKAAANLGPKSWSFLYNPATVFAQAYAKVLIAPKLSADRRAELAKQYLSQAIELLIEAHRLAGPQFREAFVEALRTDSALDPIRQQPDFLSALKTLDPSNAPKE